MALENIPDPIESIDIIAKTGILKIESENLEVTLRNHKTLNLQPKESIFGLEISPDSAKVTFDTKKLKEQNKPINTKDILDRAIGEYFQEPS